MSYNKPKASKLACSQMLACENLQRSEVSSIVANGNRSTSNTGVTTLLTLVVVVAALYFARAIFIPLALAVLLAFLLAPLVVRLRHWGLGRLPSTIIVVLFSFLMIAIIGGVMTSQLADLAHKLPEYEQNINKKLELLKSSGGGVISRVTRFARRVTEELTPTPTPTKTQPGEERPVPVEIRRTTFSPLELVRNVLGSALNVVLTAAIVIVFVVFMLIQREDLRDRLIRLLGAGRVNVTTQALDEAGQRVSRYLLALLGVNIVYGVVVGIGLYFIGVPNPLLWGLLAGLLRYIPYLGIWIAAAMPAAVAFGVAPGWGEVFIIFGLYFGVDLLIYNFVEPQLYGSSTGISPIAILVAAVFWTWLWGPVGLLLATPLTVCLVVLGRYVPSLEFLSVILSDEPVLSPETRFYQRLLAMNVEEATEVAEKFLKGKSLEKLYDSLLVPALTLAEEDRHRGRLSEEREEFVFKTTRILVDDLAERADELIDGKNSSRGHGRKLSSSRKNGEETGGLCALCIPARDEADEIAAHMLVQLLSKSGVRAKALPSAALAGESLEEVSREKPRVVCVSAVPPLGYMHARYLCRRLRAEFPELKLVAAILTERDMEEVKKRRPEITSDEVATSLKQALTGIMSLAPTANNERQSPALSHSE